MRRYSWNIVDNTHSPHYVVPTCSSTACDGKWIHDRVAVCEMRKNNASGTRNGKEMDLENLFGCQGQTRLWPPSEKTVSLPVPSPWKPGLTQLNRVCSLFSCFLRYWFLQGFLFEDWSSHENINTAHSNLHLVKEPNVFDAERVKNGNYKCCRLHPCLYSNAKACKCHFSH